MPSNAYSFTTTSVTIPAGQLYAITSVTFYKALLDPSISYVLPIKIVSGTGAQITANLNIHYFHFIGNDFAGAYEHFYTRWNDADTTTGASTLVEMWALLHSHRLALPSSLFKQVTTPALIMMSPLINQL